MTTTKGQPMEEAQPPTSPQLGRGIWQQYTIADGLPDMKIECIFEDSRGDLWIGTHDRGVVRFDGITFEGFSRREGLAGHGVYSVIEDRDGLLWFGTSGGLTRYDGKTFETVDCGGDHSFLWGSCLDEKGVLWFGVERQEGAPATVVRVQGGRAKAVQGVPGLDSGGASIHQIVDHDGRVVCAGSGLYVASGTTLHTIDADTDWVLEVQSLVARRDGSLWLASGHGVYLVVLGEEVQYECISAGLNVETMWDGVDGRLWLATHDGRIMTLDGGSLSIEETVGAQFWRGMCRDSSGRFWVSTYGMGLYCQHPELRHVSERDGLPADEASCLTLDGAGRVWIGTKSGLAVADGNTVRRVGESGEQHASEITALAPGSDGSVWAGTRMGTLQEYGDGEWCSEFATDFSGYRIGAVAVSADGAVWFGCSHGEGIGCLRGGELTHYSEALSRQYPTWIGAMVVDQDGRVLLGSSSPSRWDGLCQADTSGFRRVGDGFGGPVSCIACDKQGRTWVGTTEGLVCESESGREIYGEEHGLSCCIVTAIAEGPQGELWVGTEGGGTYCFDGVCFQSVVVKGVPALNKVNDVCVDTDGVVWAATEGGVIRYEPSRTPPSVRLEQVVTPDGTFRSPEGIQLSEGNADFTASFKAWSDTDLANDMVYRHMLEGIDGDWSAADTTTVSCRGLPRGNHRLLFQAVDRNLNYSPVLSLEVSVSADPRQVAMNEALRDRTGSGQLVGQSKALRLIEEAVASVTTNDLTVLILGETGTGKGLVARAIHEQGGRREGPFIHVNCGAIPETLIDSELFGHEKGAFTGAQSRKLGKFELADGGTIFLDEIGDLPLGVQARMLHVLQHFQIERVGGQSVIPVDVRVVAATNRDLAESARSREFRQDLYYRLAVFVIEMPPLRGRVEDIPELAEYFVARFAAHLDKSKPALSPAALAAMQAYEWPGNVRELEHMMQRAVILSDAGVIGAKQLPFGQSGQEPADTAAADVVPLREWERAYIERVLQLTNGTIYGTGGAAELLGLAPSTLRSRMSRLGVNRPQPVGRH